MMAAAARAARAPRVEPQRGEEPRPRRESAPERDVPPRARARPRVRIGVLWIVVIGALLAGIVALNVAVLGLNMTSDRLDGRISELQTRRAQLQSELSSAAAAGRIEAAAAQLGLVPPVETRYVHLGKVGP
jgi:hypothetical protein